MALQQARKRKELFEVEIRRSQRQQLFKKVRTEMLRSEEVNNAMVQFIKNRMIQIPTICIQQFDSIEVEVIEELMLLIQRKEIIFIQGMAENTNIWVVNCNAINNIKFMSKLLIVSPEILVDFFQCTLLANRSYNALLDKLDLQVKESKCLFGANINQENGQLQQGNLMDLESQSIKQRIVVLLQFWGKYFQHSLKFIQIDDFRTVLKLYQIFAEYSNIFCQRETFRFIKQMCNYIKISCILNQYKKKQIVFFPIAKDCHRFIDNVQKRLPFIIKKAVDYRLFYSQIAEILLELYELSKQQPGIFYQCLFTCEYIQNFIYSLLKTDNNHEYAFTNKIMALRVINCVSLANNSFNIFYLEGALSITKVLALELIFQAQSQRACAIVLQNLIGQDQDQLMMKTIQLMDFQELVRGISKNNQIDVFDLLIKIIETYQKSIFIHKKLLNECHLQERIRQFSKQSKNNVVYCRLMRLVRTNIEYYMTNFPKMINQMYSYAKDSGLDENNFIAEIEKHLQLNGQQVQL